jgi:hypothetical protein
VAANFEVRVSSQDFGQTGSFFREQCSVKENTEPFGICRNVVFSTWNLQN